MNQKLVPKGGYVWGLGSGTLEHIAIAEKTLGRKLPKGAQVHHVDGNRKNNANSNLVICPNQAYHLLLHKRQKALEASGNANFQRCSHCFKYDDPALMYVFQAKKNTSVTAVHKTCANIRNNEWYKKRKGVLT